MPYDLSGYSSLFDPRDHFGPNPSNPWTAEVGPVFLPPYYRDNYLRGEALPYYLTQFELKAIRDRLRKLVGTNPFAISALSNRCHYIVGEGLTIKANPIDRSDESLAEDVQKFIDVFAEVNSLPQMQRESQWREDEDGEVFIRLFPQRSGSLAGMTYLRFIEPELVRDPRGDSMAPTSFGIETVPGDVQTVLGYQIVDDPMLNYTPAFVSEAEVCHKKSTTRATAKRGLPKLYQVEPNLRRAEDLLASMSSMAKLRAKIAFIRKMTGTGKTAAESFQENLAEVQQTDPLTAATRNIERFPLGSILTASKNVEYEFPTAGMGVAEFIPVLDAELRSVCSHLNMPEWMLSGNAGNSNYSASFVAESVCVKAFQTEQDRLRSFWVESRYGNRKSILWRALEVAIDAGIFPEDLGARVRLVAEAPSLIARDQDREASTNKLYYDMKVKSRQRIQQELGIDPAEEDDQILNDKVAEAQAEKQQALDGTAQQEWNRPQTRMQTVRVGGKAAEVAESMVLQPDGESCGAACAMAVGRHYKVGPPTLEAWRAALGTDENGTPPEKIRSYFESLGLRAVGVENLTLDRLREHTQGGCSVICAVSDGSEGHYVTVAEVGDTTVTYTDPARGRVEMPHALWMERWYDTGVDDTEYNRFGIIVEPSEEDQMNRAVLDAVKMFGERLEALKPAASQPPIAVHVNIPNDLFASMKPPDVVVNVAAPEPTVVNVEAPEVHVAAPNVTVESPTIQVAAPNVTMEPVVVPAPQVVINQPPEAKLVDLQFNRDGSGKIVSATAIKE